MTIRNDREFRAALDALPVGQQRCLAARFIDRVLPLCPDARVGGAVHAALRHDVSADELAVAWQGARAASVESYTQCGKEANWNSQAGHFVAEAAVACVRPVTGGANPAWEAAMGVRMARTCQTIASGEGTENSEADAQYRIVEAFLEGRTA